MMKCDWCGGEFDFMQPAGGLHYCSHNCEDRALEHAEKRLKALSEGEEPPCKENFRESKTRTKKWTPVRMHYRIKALVCQENG